MSLNDPRSCAVLKARVFTAIVLVSVPCFFPAAAVAGEQPDGALSLCHDARLELSDLVGMAVATHPSVFARKAALAAAEADPSVARWQYYPAPSISAPGSRLCCVTSSSL